MAFEATGSAPQAGLCEPGMGPGASGYGLPEWTTRLIEDDDPRVIAALEAYLEAAERGEKPDRRAFIERHAELAPRLAECLESLDRLADVARHFDTSRLEETGPYPPSGVDVQPPGRLGDYQILREIGRGGMGVVYEAEQISLGRKVALKLLPFTAAIDPKQVQRFQVEVQAAAHLHHPHIVPIYAVGCESGVHYYAMQLISGQSLASLVAGFRDALAKGQEPWISRSGASSPFAVASSSQGGPDRRSGQGPGRRPAAYFRHVARLGIEAALALEHAHGLGVVHRDIKPANLLIDDRAQLWVADFGLARLQGDSGLTASGDLLGTIRYMSPEQALSRRGFVDHRTDIYSLGVTLYELLALQPAFRGGDIPSLIRQISEEEPVPPGRFNPQVPRDLETIVMKAMSKEPAGRYASAQELAEDLERFLDDRPILACRPSPAERAVRWARRHRAFVLSGAVALMLALVCLSIGTAIIWTAMSRAEREALAKEAELNRAQRNLEMVHRVLDLYLDAAESWFPRDPGSELPSSALLKIALSYYEQIASQNGSDPGVKARTSAAYSRVGDVRAALGDEHGALEAYRQAMLLLVDRLDRQPAADRDRLSLAEVLGKFGKILRRNGIYGPAEWSFNESVRLFEEALVRDPHAAGTRLALAHALNEMASLQGEIGRIEEALAVSKKSLDLLLSVKPPPVVMNGNEPLQLKKELASIYNNLGKWLQLGGRLAEAEDVYRKVLAMEQELRVEGAGVPDIRESIALSEAMLGQLLRATRRDDGAETLLKQAIAELERLVADYPRVPRFRDHAARVYIVLSTLYWDTDRFPESEEARRRAARFNPKLRHGQQVHLNNLAWYLITAPNPAARNPRRALELATRALGMDPEHWGVLNTLGVARYRNQDWDGARQALEAAIQKKASRFAFDGYFLAMSYWQLGRRDDARQLLETAERWRLGNEPDDVELLRFRAEAEQLIGPIHCCDHATAPALPRSIGEALRSPWFALPRYCPAPDPGTQEARRQGQGPEPREAERPNFKVSEVVDPALLFIELS
jgi:serine/threonine protein kinase